MAKSLLQSNECTDTSTLPHVANAGSYMTPCRRTPVLLCLHLLVLALPVFSQQNTAQQGPISNPQLSEDRFRSIEAEQQSMRQALKDSKEDTRYLVGGLVTLFIGGFISTCNRRYSRMTSSSSAPIIICTSCPAWLVISHISTCVASCVSLAVPMPFT